MANAGLMDSLTDTVTSSVTSTAKEMAGSAMDSASNEAIKKALDIKEGGSNKQAIRTSWAHRPAPRPKPVWMCGPMTWVP